MRIVAGYLGGRQFDSPSGHRTHPMSEKVRGALFNMLGDIEGLSVLDAYSGSGALSLEAISRGAVAAVAIDSDKNAFDVMVKNGSTLGVTDKIKTTQAKISSWLDNNPELQFDIVLADPPYDKVRQDLLGKLASHSKNNGIIVFSLPPNSEFSLPTTSYKLLTTNSYGDATLVFYRRIS